MSVMNQIKNFFGASLPIVALDSPSAEESTTLENLFADVARPLRLPLYAYDIAAGLRQVVPAEEHTYLLGGAIYTGEVIQEGDEYLTSDRQPLTLEVTQSTGIDYQPIQTNFKHPVLDVFRHIEAHQKPGMFVLIDFQGFLEGDRALPEARRYIKHLAGVLKRSYKRVVLLGQDIKLGNEYSGLIYEAANKLPSLSEIEFAIGGAIADITAELSAGKKEFTCAITPQDRDNLFTSCQGLTIEEALNALRVDARDRYRIDGQTAEFVTQFKIQKLEKLGIKFCPRPDVEPGGIDVFKKWVQQRKRLFNTAIASTSSKLKLPTPKGCLIVGPSGTGKSLLAKTLGYSWNAPILQVDIGSFYGSLVGETEANFRKFTQLIDNLGPVVVLFDEVEKALGAIAGGGASNDSGVSQRLFGALLTWMNDKTSPCFIVATANDISKLPPEFKRKGRFDEIWFVDAPNAAERKDILSVHLARHGTTFSDRALNEVVALSDDFVGAELGQAVNEAAILSAEAGLDEIGVDELKEAIACTVPLARSQADTLAFLRDWAASAARYASNRDEVTPAVAVKPKRGSKAKMLIEE